MSVCTLTTIIHSETYIQRHTFMRAGGPGAFSLYTFLRPPPPPPGLPPPLPPSPSPPGAPPPPTPTCFPISATVLRQKTSGIFERVRMDQLAIGDTLQCLLPALDGSIRRTRLDTCQIYYNL